MTDKPEFGTLGKSLHRDGEGFIAMCEDTPSGRAGDGHTGEEWAAWLAAVLNRFPELEAELDTVHELRKVEAPMLSRLPTVEEENERLRLSLGAAVKTLIDRPDRDYSPSTPTSRRGHASPQQSWQVLAEAAIRQAQPLMGLSQKGKTE